MQPTGHMGAGRRSGGASRGASKGSLGLCGRGHDRPQLMRIFVRPHGDTQMNLEQLKRNVGDHVSLHPGAVCLDDGGNELRDFDDDWAIREVSKDGVRIENISTGHTVLLGPDHIHHYTSNPGRRTPGIRHGFLSLTVQLFLQGWAVHIRPTSRPGERTTFDGKSPEARAARARLLDERFRMVMADYALRGTPSIVLESFTDLSIDEKAELYDRAIKLKKGRPPKRNPFRS
jgi:hypothetical protein